MPDTAKLSTRSGTVADAAAIAEIYNQGMADRMARSRPSRARLRTSSHGSLRSIC